MFERRCKSPIYTKSAAFAAISLFVSVALLGATSSLVAANEAMPACMQRADGETVQAALRRARPAAEELLARLAYAEGISTGFADDPLVYQAIAWGVMNRVRLAEHSLQMRKRYGSGIDGVIFRQSQFNPAVSARSPHARDFLCPRNAARWQLALRAADAALSAKNNPFIQTAWEKAHGLSLVVNFYYPRSAQARGPLAPWEGSKELEFIGNVKMADAILPAERVRLYRLKAEPRLRTR